KLFGTPGSGNGGGGSSHGLPRFDAATFRCRFPFATVNLQDSKVPLQVEITAWSPFEPGDPDNASLPVAGLDYRFKNTSAHEGDSAAGATLFVPFHLGPGETRTITVRLAWYSGESNLRFGEDPKDSAASRASEQRYKPWYSGRFGGVEQAASYWRDHYADLRK